MSERDSERGATFLSAEDDSSCRVETQGGTVYWLSQVGEDGMRWIVREHLESSDTNTMVVQDKGLKEGFDLGDKFRGRLDGEVRVGMPLVLEVSGRETRIRSEVVVDLEVGGIPQMIFGCGQ